jgi:hypothetical protein
MKNSILNPNMLFCAALSLTFLCSCSRNNNSASEEQIRVSVDSEIADESDSLANSIAGNSTMKQVATFPNNVILTGLSNHRLVSIYQSKVPRKESQLKRISKFSSYGEYGGDESVEHYMPGLDILYGYNLWNIAHYDLITEKGNYLFNHPVLIKTVYYPSFVQDSINKVPVNRDYYLVSVYDKDTNKDTLITKNDLRGFYHFDASTLHKKQLIPDYYSVLRSQYDSKNDVMYIFARQDENKNGMQEDTEAVHIFWISLKTPDMAKRLY